MEKKTVLNKKKSSIKSRETNIELPPEQVFAIRSLYEKIYSNHPDKETCWQQIIEHINNFKINRPEYLKQRDDEKINMPENWFLSNHLCGMSLYVDRFCGNLKNLPSKLDYIENLGVNLLHLMPLFESPKNESDGGYAVSDFKKVDAKFGTNEDLQNVQNALQKRGMYLMLDIVLNHTSHKHEWAMKAKQGDAYYQNFFYFFDDRQQPDKLDKTMPEIFPESSPGNFTYVPELNKWVMTVFHHYQWDLNYRNPAVFAAMLEHVFFYANLGVDILRIDAPAFIWKKEGTDGQNLNEAHTLLQLIKACVLQVAPSMALLGEAIVAPAQIMKYFGTNEFTAKECDFAYNATHMALQWDALATGNTSIMLNAQHELLKKPYGTSWITYTRCHDDIGLGYDDYMIQQAGFNPFEHRKFLKDYYSGVYYGSKASGALFSINDKTGDARISGSLASLCGLERAFWEKDDLQIQLAIQKIIFMQAHSFFIGGLPMLFYGDEAAYTNDYSYKADDGKSYDNRWMHRPLINWEKNKKVFEAGTIENKIYNATQRLLKIRKQLKIITDRSNIYWLRSEKPDVAAFGRVWKHEQFFGVFNFSNNISHITAESFYKHGFAPKIFFDHWLEKEVSFERKEQILMLNPYQFYLLELKGN